MNLTEALDVSSRIHLAKVLLPEQVAREQSSLKQRPNLPPYLIHTSLPDDVVTRLEGQRDAPLLPRFTVFPLPCGPMLAVATVQAGDLQLRTAVPLVDLPAYAWVQSCTERGELAWLVEVLQRNQAVLVRTLCPFSNLAELRTVLARGRTPTPEGLVADLGDACVSLVQPDFIGSCAPGLEVKEVHVAMVWSALAKPGMVAAVDAALAALPKVH